VHLLHEHRPVHETEGLPYDGVRSDEVDPLINAAKALTAPVEMTPGRGFHIGRHRVVDKSILFGNPIAIRS
jgi:hypothetical protein